MELIEGPSQQMEGNKAVKYMFRDGEWKWNEFSFELSSNVKEKISAMPFQLFGNKDTLIWKVTKDGSSVQLQHIPWQDLKKIKRLLSWGKGFRSWTHSLEFHIFYGFVTLIVYPERGHCS